MASASVPSPKTVSPPEIEYNADSVNYDDKVNGETKVIADDGQTSQEGSVGSHKVEAEMPYPPYMPYPGHGQPHYYDAVTGQPLPVPMYSPYMYYDYYYMHPPSPGGPMTANTGSSPHQGYFSPDRASSPFPPYPQYPSPYGPPYTPNLSPNANHSEEPNVASLPDQSQNKVRFVPHQSANQTNPTRSQPPPPLNFSQHPPVHNNRNNQQPYGRFSSPYRGNNSTTPNGMNPPLGSPHLPKGNFNYNMSYPFYRNPPHFNSPSSSSTASSVSSTPVGNSTPRQSHARTLSNTSSNNGPNNNTNIYIRGLKPATTDEWLYDIAKDYGTIVSSKAIIDIPTEVCKGFGFVMYETEQEARRAMEGLSKMGFQVSFARVKPNAPPPYAQLNNQRIGTPYHIPISQFQYPPQVVLTPNGSFQNSGGYFGNITDQTEEVTVVFSKLPGDITEESFTEILQPLNVNSVKLETNEQSGESIGKVKFETREFAVEAVKKFNGHTLPGSSECLIVKIEENRRYNKKQNYGHNRSAKGSDHYAPYYSSKTPGMVPGQPPSSPYSMPTQPGMYPPMYLYPGNHPYQYTMYPQTPPPASGHPYAPTFPPYDIRSATVTPTPTELTDHSYHEVTALMENNLQISQHPGESDPSYGNNGQE